jgi:two-component system, OmpR family, phosphate regulon sensor histidine kinase PhoR
MMKSILGYITAWILTCALIILCSAWIWTWQVATWIAWALIVLVIAWEAVHIKWLLTALQQQQQIATRPSSTPIYSIDRLQKNLHTPTSIGTWGNVFYLLRRLIKAHRLELATVKTQQNRLMQAVHASPNAFILLDRLGCIAWLNNAAQRLLGLDAQRDTGQKLAFLLRTPAITALLDSTRTHQPVTIEMNKRLIEIQSLPFDEQQTLLLGQDLTKIARTEQVRRDFIANVSHELRTPLTVLTGYTELLLDHVNTLPPILQDAVSHMAQHTQRMNSLTQDLLQLAALDASNMGDALINPETINVQEWLSEVQRSTVSLTQMSHGKITVLFEDCDAHLKIAGSKKELHSALSNLIDNAVRYTPAEGIVKIAVDVVSKDTHTDSTKQLHIMVTDTGCGIEAIHLPRLTERFYRVSTSRHRGFNEENTGTGLGLAIVKHIMLRHSGELRISSTVGKGSCFTLVLPVLT